MPQAWIMLRPTRSMRSMKTRAPPAAAQDAAYLRQADAGALQVVAGAHPDGGHAGEMGGAFFQSELHDGLRVAHLAVRKITFDPAMPQAYGSPQLLA